MSHNFDQLKGILMVTIRKIPCMHVWNPQTIWYMYSLSFPHPITTLPTQFHVFSLSKTKKIKQTKKNAWAWGLLTYTHTQRKIWLVECVPCTQEVPGLIPSNKKENNSNNIMLWAGALTKLLKNLCIKQLGSAFHMVKHGHSVAHQ